MMEHRVERVCPADHPALGAWSEITKSVCPRAEVEMLKDRSACQAYRLFGLGPGNANVIAKRYPESKARAEFNIYRNVLRQMPLISPRHYGLVREEGTEFCWAFFEDVAGRPYDPAVAVQGVEAAKWLAGLHASARDLPADLDLPDRGPRHYFDCLRYGRNRIRRHLSSTLLSEDDRTVLAALTVQCDAVEAKREWIEDWCRSVPETFVHADLHAANIHVRPHPHGITLVPFDWESAGWGVPAIDLALEGVDLTTYCAIAGQVWPNLDIEAVLALSNIGKIFQLLELLAWESQGLDSQWTRRPMKHMRHYQAELSRAILEIGCAPPPKSHERLSGFTRVSA
jgi:phosphotransferase family enzyme